MTFLIIYCLELNLVSEVCITIKKYAEALKMFIYHGNLTFTPVILPSDFDSQTTLLKSLGSPNRECRLQPGLHSDLVQKIVIVLIHLEAYRHAEVSFNVKMCFYTLQLCSTL